jgi:hypothetical protein
MGPSATFERGLRPAATSLKYAFEFGSRIRTARKNRMFLSITLPSRLSDGGLRAVAIKGLDLRPVRPS